MHIFGLLPVFLCFIWLVHGTQVPDLTDCTLVDDCSQQPARCLSFVKRCPLNDVVKLQSYGVTFFQGFTKKLAGSRDRWYEYLGCLQERAGGEKLIRGWSWSEFFEKVSEDVQNDAQGYALEALAIALLNAVDAETFLKAVKEVSSPPTDDPAKKVFPPTTYVALFSLWPFIPEQKDKEVTRGVLEYRKFFQTSLYSSTPEQLFKVPDIKQSSLKDAMEQTFQRSDDGKSLTIKRMMQNLILAEKGKDVWLRTRYFLHHNGPLLIGSNVDLTEQWKLIADYTYGLKLDQGNDEREHDEREHDEKEKDEKQKDEKEIDIIEKLIFLVTRYADTLETQHASLKRIYIVAKAKKFCELFYSLGSRKRLTVLANLQPSRIEYYKQAVTFAFSVCLDSDALSKTKLASVDNLDILGEVKSFRVNELLETKQVCSLSFMHEYSKDQKVFSEDTLANISKDTLANISEDTLAKISKDTLENISDPSQLSLIFVSLTTLMDPSKSFHDRNSKLYRGLLKLLVGKKPDLFKTSVRSSAYRDLLWATLLHDKQYFEPVCRISEGACTSLIEKSLQDIDTDNAQQLKDWARKMNSLSIFLHQNFLCDTGALYTCHRLVDPKPATLMQLTLKITHEHSRGLVFPTVTPWILPSEFAYLDVDQLSDWFVKQAQGGSIDHFKQVLQIADQELYGTPGMMYAMLAVVHHTATNPHPFKEGIKQRLHVTESDRKPTIQDLCANKRCLIEEASKKDNDTKMPSDIKLMKGDVPKQPDTFAVPTEPNSDLLSDRFFYFLAQQCAGEDKRPLDTWRGVLKSNMPCYLKVVSSTMGIGDFKALRTNLHTCFKFGSSDMSVEMLDELMKKAADKIWK